MLFVLYTEYSTNGKRREKEEEEGDIFENYRIAHTTDQWSSYSKDNIYLSSYMVYQIDFTYLSTDKLLCEQPIISIVCWNRCIYDMSK